MDGNRPFEGKTEQISPPKKVKTESCSCFAEEGHTENRDVGSPDLDVTARMINDSLLVQVSAPMPVNQVSSISEFDDTIVSKNEIVKMQHLLMEVDEKLDMTNSKIQGVLNTINKICQCRSCLKALVCNLKNEDYVGAPAATNHPAPAMQSSVSRPAATSLQPALALLKKDILPPVTPPAAFLPPVKSPVVPVPKQ